MADPISIAKGVISCGMKIKKIIDEVKAFQEYAKRLQFKIQHMMPPFETIAGMENQREALAAAQRSEPEMMAFSKSLPEMLSLVEEVKKFIESFKGMNTLQQAAKKKKIKETYETYDYKLDTLQQSTLMGVLVEFKKKADARGKQDSIKILVRTVKNASTSLSSSTADGKIKSKLQDNIPTIASGDLNVIKELGEGGFGKVFLAKYREGERVAVKIFDVENNRSILKEVAKMCQAIFSPYIVRLRGLVDEPDTYGIVMDYFKYGSLKSFLPNLECDCWPRRVRMLCDITSGISFLHTDLTPPIAHRDIKLLNMFVDHDFTVKIGDLGLASSGTTISKVSSQAYLMGTLSHMAPELWAGNVEVATSLDIYGFGISIYEFTTGKSPWAPMNENEIRGLVLSGERPNVKFIKDDTPSEVVTMMQKCWQTDPKSRPTSQEILREFSVLYESRYEAGIWEADMVIRSKIKADEGASQIQQGGSSEGDSGMESDTLQSFKDLNVKDQDTTVKAAARTGSARSDSGIGALSAGDESVLKNMQFQDPFSDPFSDYTPSHGVSQSLLNPLGMRDYEETLEEQCHALANVHPRDLPPSYHGNRRIRSYQDPLETTVLISYQWNQQEKARKLRDKLLARRYNNVWMGIDKPEGNRLVSIANAVDQADVFLVCISRSYKASPNCQLEAQYAYQQQKPIIPIQVEKDYMGDGWLGMMVALKMYIRAYSDEVLEQDMHHLIRELVKIVE